MRRRMWGRRPGGSFSWKTTQRRVRTGSLSPSGKRSTWVTSKRSIRVTRQWLTWLGQSGSLMESGQSKSLASGQSGSIASGQPESLASGQSGSTASGQSGSLASGQPGSRADSQCESLASSQSQSRSLASGRSLN